MTCVAFALSNLRAHTRVYMRTFSNYMRHEKINFLNGRACVKFCFHLLIFLMA